MNKRYQNNPLRSIRSREMRSLLSLLGLVGLVIIVPLILEKVYFYFPLSEDTRWIRDLKPDTLNRFIGKDSSLFSPGIKKNNLPFNRDQRALEFFDPNTASEETWKKFQLADYKIRMIKKYLKKGGHFFQPEDLSRMYSLNKDEINQIRPFVKIKKDSYAEFSDRNRGYRRFSTQVSPQGHDALGKISLNSGGYEDFRKLGSLNSHEIYEILNFRARNGPFSDIRELKNLKIIDLSTYNRIEKSLTLK